MSGAGEEPAPIPVLRRIGLSLFWRIFLVMLASVASVQLVNLALVVFVKIGRAHV